MRSRQAAARAIMAVFALSAVDLAACASWPAFAKDLATPQSGDPVPSEPQQTSASFGDWVVRCDRTQQLGGKRACEVAQSLVLKGQQGPVAQIAFGHPPGDKSNDLTMTVLLPVSISFAKPPRLGSGAGADDPHAASLTYRRCVPGGCLADGKPDAALLRELRDANTQGQLTFTDAADRAIMLPLSLRGLAQALDDLAKQASRDAGVSASH